MFTDDEFREYMRLIRETPLLTAEEEADLEKAIQMGRRTEGELEALMSPELEGDPARARKLREVKQAIGAADQAKRQLVEHNLRLAAFIAMQYQGRGVAMMDLIQDANLALIKVVDSWEHQPEYRFISLASKSIHGALKICCYKSYPVHLSRSMALAVAKINIVSRVMKMQLGHDPTATEIAAEMLLPVDLVNVIIVASINAGTPASLDKPLEEEEGATLADLLPDRDVHAPEYLVLSGMLREKVESVLATLEPEEEHVIRLRFGFEDGIAHTQEQISRAFSRDLEDVRLTEVKAMRKLRYPSRSGQLVGFLN